MAAFSVSSLSAPYTVFPLSQPLNQKRAKDREYGTYRGCFSSLVESKKRKRGANGGVVNEIAVAVDGEGVNIYDIRSTQTISSYALPPTTKFSCAPASSLSRSSNAISSRRTYAAVSFPKKQIISWKEESTSQSSAEEAGEAALKQLSADNTSQYDIFYLQDMNSTVKRGKKKDINLDSGLLAVYANGQIRCFTEDLEFEKWDFQPSSLLSSGTTKTGGKTATVVYAATTSLATARKAIFKNRPDVVLPEISEDEEFPDDIVLLTIASNDSVFEIRFFSIPVSSGSPRELLILNLPSLENKVSGTSIFSVHFPSGTLHHLLSTKLMTYTLFSTVPTITTTLNLPHTENAELHPLSLLRITSSTVLVATNEDVSLYDTKFSSLQARVSLQQNAVPPTARNAISRSSTPASTATTKGIFLTSFLPELDLAIGHSSAGIVGLQFTRAGSKEGLVEKARKGGLLIDSLCRGVNGVALPLSAGIDCGDEYPELAEEKAKTEKTSEELRIAKHEGNFDAFEAVFAEYIGLKRRKTASKPLEQQLSEDNDVQMVNGLNEEISNPKVAKIEQKKLVLPEFEDQRGSETYYKPLGHNFVKAVLSMIFEKSTTEDGEERLKLSFFPPNVVKYLIESGNFSELFLGVEQGLVACLIEFDPTLRTLEWFLGTVGQLGISEVVSAVKVGLQDVLPNTEEEDRLALEVIKSEVMRLALVRLNTFPSEIIIRMLKKSMSGHDLMCLIAMLRKELVVGEQECDEASIGVGVGDVGIVSDLLTTALDAVGIGGLVLGDENEEFIQALHEEVADAVEAIEEAAGLRGILEEMFRHADWRQMAMEAKIEAEMEKGREKEKRERKKDKKKLKAAQNELLQMEIDKDNKEAAKQVNAPEGNKKHKMDNKLKDTWKRIPKTKAPVNSTKPKTPSSEPTTEDSKDREKEKRKAANKEARKAAAIARIEKAEATKNPIATPAKTSAKPPSKTPTKTTVKTPLKTPRIDSQRRKRTTPGSAIVIKRRQLFRKNSIKLGRTPTQKKVSPLLPLGLLPPPAMGGKIIPEGEGRKERNLDHRQNLMAGIYSVESIFI